MVFAVSFAVYTLVIVAVGVWSARYAARSNEDYFLAGRGLGPWVAALSASASSESGWVTLGLVGWAFTSGMIAYWVIPGCLLGFAFNWFIMAGRMREHSEHLGALTLPELFSLHFKERLPLLRVLTVIVILVAMWLYVAAQFAAAGDAFQSAFGVDYRLGVVIGTVIVLLYTVIGGFRAACWTDFIQGIVMVGTLIIFPLYLIIEAGGFGAVREQLAGIDESMVALWPQKTGAALVGFLLGSGALGINLGFCGQPHILVRFMALRSRRDSVMCGIISITWGAFVFWGAVTVGLVVRVMTEQSVDWTGEYAVQLAENATGAGQTGLVLAAKNMIPGVLSGIVLSAVLAAICSTADSQLVVAASAGANDLLGAKHMNDRRRMLINRTVLFGLGIGAMLLVIDERVEVYKFVLEFGWAVLGAAIGPQIILLLLWKRATYAGCLAGMATGFALALTWKQLWAAFQKGLDETHWLAGVSAYNLTVAFFAALVVNVVVSLLTSARPRD
jgi:sodium/proline symporter